MVSNLSMFPAPMKEDVHSDICVSDELNACFFFCVFCLGIMF